MKTVYPTTNKVCGGIIKCYVIIKITHIFGGGFSLDTSITYRYTLSVYEKGTTSQVTKHLSIVINSNTNKSIK